MFLQIHVSFLEILLIARKVDDRFATLFELLADVLIYRVDIFVYQRVLFGAGSGETKQIVVADQTVTVLVQHQET